MTKAYSVAIIGAGPTGLILANLLGKLGVRTLLVEANAATVSEPRAVSIDDESLRVVQQIDLLDIVQEELVSGYGSEYLGPDGSMFLKVKPQERPYGHPRRNAFRQPIFERQLRDGLTRFPGIETRFDCRMRSFVEETDGVWVELAGADGPTIVRADYLIGCDGSWSETREALGYALAGSSLDEHWLIVDLENCPNPSPETLVFCDPKRPGIMLPGPRDTRRYEFKMMPGESAEVVLADESIARLLRDHRGVQGSHIVRKTVYHFHARIAEQWGRGRIWLAGDAAHLMPPFAGQGMNSGIRDAANLAWKLDAIVKGALGPHLLESYERERRAHVAEMIRLAVRMGRVFGPPSALQGLAIRTAFRALKLWPAARAYFAEMRYKPAPRFDAGFLLEDQLSHDGLVGRMLPQPELPGGFGKSSLDDCLGAGFALVGIGIAKDELDAVFLGDAFDRLCTVRLALDPHELPAFSACQGSLLVVRPDRYVMAQFTRGDVREIGGRLDALVQRTWSSGPDSTQVPAPWPAVPEPTRADAG